MAFEVSTARLDITPTLATNPYLAGYGAQGEARVAASDAPYSPLYARCIVLWDDSSPNAIVTLDVLGIPRSVNQALRPRLAALAPWAPSDVVLQATHTHNGPVLVDALHPYISYGLTDLALVTSYTAWLEDRIVEVVQTALDAPRTPVTLDYQVRSIGIARNRVGLPYVETAVPMLTARAQGGVPRAVVFSYGCHPISAGLATLYDGDFPAGACEFIEDARPGCFAMYLQGPAGDQDPAGPTGWNLRDTHSTQLGTEVSNAVDNPGRQVTGPIRTSYLDVDLPLEVTITAGNLAAVRASFVARIDDPAGLPAWYVRHAEVMINRIDSDQIATSVRNPVQVWKLGGSPDLRVALVGGELVSGYGVYFRSLFGGTNGLLIGGYANEVSCYIPSNEFLPPFMPGGSYEGGWHSDFPGIAGGSQTVYGHLGRFRSGGAGVEPTLISALSAQLA